MNEELLLSPEILMKATKSGKEYGWKISDVPSVLSDAKNNNLANLGGQLQYVFPDGTCELYWMDIDAGARAEGESWKDWVEMSYEICSINFQALIKNSDFFKEAEGSSSFIKEKIKAGIDVTKNEAFILYFEKRE